MHPMMALAALRGCIAVEYRSGGIRVVRELRVHARALYDDRFDRATCGTAGVRDGLASPSYYKPASLAEFVGWDHITEADLDWLCETDA